MKRLLYILFLFCLSVSAFANNRSGECPPWVNGDLPPKTNTTYYFMKEEGSGLTISEARKDADLSLVSSLMRAAGVTVSGSQIETILSQNHNGVIDETHKAEYRYDFELDKVHLAFKAVDMYWEKTANRYDCKVLYEVAYNPSNVVYDPVEYTSKYGARGLWRSAIIPGWGQMYKKSYIKGSAILIVEAAAITTAVIFNNRYNSYIDKSKATTNADAIRFYQNKANNAKNFRNGFFAGAAAVYVYNIVDAIAAKGKLRYLKPKGHTLSFSPYFSPDNSYGISMAYIF